MRKELKYHGRLKPYTEIGIRRVPCARCRKPSTQQWQVCANGGRYLGICAACDVELNRMALDFMRMPGRRELIRRYERKMKWAGPRSRLSR